MTALTCFMITPATSTPAAGSNTGYPHIEPIKPANTAREIIASDLLLTFKSNKKT
jgi:hypothetical protein